MVLYLPQEIFEAELTEQMVFSLEFDQGLTSPCIFRLDSREVDVCVHGDDVIAVGSDESLDWFRESFKKHFELSEKFRLGPDSTDSKHGSVLNRLLTWVDGIGVELEPDPRHVSLIIAELGLNSARACNTPGAKRSTEVEQDLGSYLEPPCDKSYRATTARSNFLAQDWYQLLFSVKECCRTMSSPTTVG